MGAIVVDADEVAKEQWDAPGVRRLAAERWGADFFTGDKKDVYPKIAARIFSDETEYKFATKLIHEATFKEIKRIVARSAGWVVLEVPLLFESGRYQWLDYIVYASAAFEKRVERRRSQGWDEKEMKRRESWFMPREEKLSLSDFVLENNGTVEEWEEKGRQLGQFFLEQMRAKKQFKG